MYAVIKTGGKQYKVAAGEKLKVEQIPADIGAEITIDQVLAVGAGDQLSVGTPLVAGATVSATVLSQGRHDKVRIFKMRRRKHYRKQQGHRQNYTELFISGIASAAGSVTAEVPAIVRPNTDDLEKIEGIGPKIRQVFAAAGISSYAQLAETPVERLQELLKSAGPRFASHDPTTWPEQAKLAAAGDWDAFKALTDDLFGVPEQDDKGRVSPTAKLNYRKRTRQLEELFSGNGETTESTWRNGRPTKWTAFQAITEYIDWITPVKGGDKDVRRFERTMDASVQNLKARALEALS